MPLRDAGEHDMEVVHICEYWGATANLLLD
jgi:hypothetical protein